MVDCARVQDLVDLEIDLKKAILELVECLRSDSITPNMDRILERFLDDVETYMQLVKKSR